MKELDDLIDYCHNKYINETCSHCTNQVGMYCAKCLYPQGSCSECLNHILNENKPSFHYPCQRITYYYCLHFFDRFVSEIRRFFYYSKPKGTYFNFVSLGCGPGSELFGIIEGLRQCLGNNFRLKYRGYDLEPIWNDVQMVTKSLFAGSNCDVDFYNKDMFREWQDAEDCEVQVLVLNYLLSDCQKFMPYTDLTTFLDNIVNFIIMHKVSVVMYNDIRLVGFAQMDSGLKCIEYILNKLTSFVTNVKVAKVLYPEDTYKLDGWFEWKSKDLLMNLDKTKTCIANPWTECRSKYIVASIRYN